MGTEGIYIRAQNGDFCLGEDVVKLYGFEYFPDRKIKHIAQPLIVKEEKESKYAGIEPFAIIERRNAQKLMDDLWDCGLRPSEGTGSAGAFKAKEEHLSDIKKIAFKLLKLNE